MQDKQGLFLYGTSQNQSNPIGFSVDGYKLDNFYQYQLQLSVSNRYYPDQSPMVSTYWYDPDCPDFTLSHLDPVMNTVTLPSSWNQSTPVLQVTLTQSNIPSVINKTSIQYSISTSGSIVVSNKNQTITVTKAEPSVINVSMTYNNSLLQQP